jgi:hypothetical protein
MVAFLPGVGHNNNMNKNTEQALLQAAQEMVRYIDQMASRQQRTHAEFDPALARWKTAVSNAHPEKKPVKVTVAAQGLFATRASSGAVQYTAEASELGLPPGFWPLEVELVLPDGGWTLTRQSITEEATVYGLANTLISLKIWND